MAKLKNSAVHIKQTKKKILSAAQKKFNNAIKNIAKEKERLQNWQAVLPEYHGKVLNEYQPLQNKLAALQIEFVHRLDKFHGRRSFTKAQKDKISYMICDLCSNLISSHNRDDLKSMYEKHSEDDFDEHHNQHNEIIKSMLEDSLGVDLGDDFDISDPDKVTAHLKEKIEELKNNMQENEVHGGSEEPESKKTVKQKAEEENISQSIKSVYRQLITELHPDREADPDERDRKTEIMQRVNAAYKEKDLLGLLELQLELEQIDQDHINTIAEDRLNAYNKILQNQLKQLRQEIEHIQIPFRAMVNTPPGSHLNPKELICMFNDDVEALQQDVNSLTEDLSILKTVKSMKEMLRNVSQQREEDFLEELFSSMGGFNSNGRF